MKTYSIGGGSPCPEIPDSLPTSIAELNAIFACKDLPLDNEEDVWCASVSTCAGGKLVSIYQHGELIQQDSDGSVRAALSSPDQWLDGNPRPLGEAERVFLQAQTLPTSEMPSLLVSCMQTYAAVPAVNDLHANVTLEYYREAPEQPIVNTFSLSGMVASDGRFALLIPSQSTVEGENQRTVVQELAFDGATLFEGYQGEPYYRAYSSGCQAQDRSLALHARYLNPLHDWVADPLRVLRFPGTRYSTEVLPEGRVRITESYTQTGIESQMGLGTTTYTIDRSTGTAHVVQIDIKNDNGDLLLRREFSNFRPLGVSSWRPLLITEQTYGRGEDMPHLTKTIQILSAMPLKSTEIDAEWWRPASDDNWWYIYN